MTKDQMTNGLTRLRQARAPQQALPRSRWARPEPDSRLAAIDPDRRPCTVVRRKAARETPSDAGGNTRTADDKPSRDSNRSLGCDRIILLRFRWAARDQFLGLRSRPSEIARPSSRAADYRESRRLPAALAPLLPYRAISDCRVTGRLLFARGTDLGLPT